mgnify:CR=1 FL=1
MDRKEAIQQLEKLKKSRAELKLAYQRKRSWRPSEIAMAAFHVDMDIEAIDTAIQSLKENSP